MHDNDPDNDYEYYDVPHHLDLRRDAISDAATHMLREPTSLDEWERECIHEPERWHPRHVLALIRALKHTHAQLSDATSPDPDNHVPPKEPSS